MNRLPRGGRRLVAGIAIGIAFTLVVSVGVSADTVIRHHGKVGAASLRDTAVDGNGGARCAYSFSDGRDGGAATIKVRAPRVWARDRSAGVDHQIVGWQVLVQQTPADIGFGTWYTVYTSTVRKASATDSVKASFSPRTFAVPFNTFVRARVLLLWYAPGSSSIVQGSQVRSVDHYDRYLGTAFEDQVTGYCPPDLLNPM